jgi:hypothetical protein
MSGYILEGATHYTRAIMCDDHRKNNQSNGDQKYASQLLILVRHFVFLRYRVIQTWIRAIIQLATQTECQRQPITPISQGTLKLRKKDWQGCACHLLATTALTHRQSHSNHAGQDYLLIELEHFSSPNFNRVSILRHCGSSRGHSGGWQCLLVLFRDCCGGQQSDRPLKEHRLSTHRGDRP